MFFGPSDSKSKRLKRPPDPVLVALGSIQQALQCNTAPAAGPGSSSCKPTAQMPPRQNSRPPPPVHPGWVGAPPPPMPCAGPPPPQPHFSMAQAPPPGYRHATSWPVPAPQALPFDARMHQNGPLLNPWQGDMGEPMAPRDPLLELITSKFNAVITLIDEEKFSGDERDLVVQEDAPLDIRGGGSQALAKNMSRGADRAISNAIKKHTNFFVKANLYANSRVRGDLAPFRVFMATWPLLCLAVSYSEQVYTKPRENEEQTYIEPDWRMGTKAMVIKSVPLEHHDTLVFAIRGSQTFVDWLTNVWSAPASPEGFLDDPGNLCHRGFLSVARQMVKPVAARIRALLEEDPSRACGSLLLTGHSAGGAVASLLYAHMLSRTVVSELKHVTECFRRIHCITFGAPPISLLPLQKPLEYRNRHSLFLSFVNEGDPVPRADRAYVLALMRLYSTPAPRITSSGASTARPPPPARQPQATTSKRAKAAKQPGIAAPDSPAPPPPLASRLVWTVPPSTLSNAGRLVLLRSSRASSSSSSSSSPPSSGGNTSGGGGGGGGGSNDIRTNKKNDVIEALYTFDEELRGVVFGDPIMHMMKIYAERIETLATNAALAKHYR